MGDTPYLRGIFAHLQENLPPALMQEKRWVTWRWGGTRNKPTKVPVNWKTGANLNATKVSSGTNLDDVLDSPLTKEKASGIGIIVGDGLCGIDLDGALESGEAKDWARSVLDRFPGTYIESSISGTGLHILCLGTKPEGKCRCNLGDGHIEVYGSDRYLCVSGRRFEEAPAELRDCTQEITELVAELFGQPADDKGAAATTVHIGAGFPEHKHRALLENSVGPRSYRATWEHKRRDMKDDSLSAYDLALCNLAFRAGWSDDELGALIRQHRAYYGETAKAVRGDYVRRTVAAARARLAASVEEDEARRVVEAPVGAPREERLRALATALRIPLTNVLRITGEVPVMRFVCGEQSVELPMEQVVKQATLRGKLYSATGIMMRAIGPREAPGWDIYCERIAEVAETVEVGEEATLDGTMLSLLRSFVDSRSIEECPVGQTVERPQDPFLRENHVWFRPSDVLQYAGALGGFRGLERSRLLQRLRTLGATRVVFAVRKRGKDPSGEKANTTATFYGLPAETLGIEVEPPKGALDLQGGKGA